MLNFIVLLHQIRNNGKIIKVADNVSTVNITIHPHTAFAQYITMSGSKTFCTEIKGQRDVVQQLSVHPNPVTLAQNMYVLTKLTTLVQIVDFGYNKSYGLQQEPIMFKSQIHLCQQNGKTLYDYPKPSSNIHTDMQKLMNPYCHMQIPFVLIRGSGVWGRQECHTGVF